MAMTWAQEGKGLILENTLNKTAPSTWKFHLYTNNYTPVAGMTTAAFTEDTAAGYASVDMTPASWTITNPTGTEEKAAYPKITITYTAASTVYGYYITNAAGTKVFGAENFSDGPYTLGNSGGNINVTLSASIL